MDESEIYMSVRRDLMRYATALTGPDTADDVVSAVVTRALTRSGGLSGLREPKQYLMRSVLNELRSCYGRTIPATVVVLGWDAG